MYSPACPSLQHTLFLWLWDDLSGLKSKALFAKALPSWSIPHCCLLSISQWDGGWKREMQRFYCRRVDSDVFCCLHLTTTRKSVISLHSGRLHCRLFLAGKSEVQFFSLNSLSGRNSFLFLFAFSNSGNLTASEWWQTTVEITLEEKKFSG